MIASFGVIAFFIAPETYHPVLLQRRAARLGKENNNPAYYSLLDNSAPTFRDILTKYLFRPFQMLAMEPILVCFTIYISLIYGILYLFFTAYPISFAGHPSPLAVSWCCCSAFSGCYGGGFPSSPSLPRLTTPENYAVARFGPKIVFYL
jgi:hypothetical protein